MSDGKQVLRIRFEDVSVAEAGKKAAKLRQDLLDVSPQVEAEIEKEDETTQDFGTVLVLVLGTEAIVAIAKGIADYLRRDRGTIALESDGRVVAEGISGEDAARIAEALSPRA